MISIVDTDVLMAVVNADDALHERVVELGRKLEDSGIDLVILPTTLAEFSLVGLKKLGMNRVREVLGIVRDGRIIVEKVVGEDVVKATELFEKQTSKNESLCDCFVMAVARRIGAGSIFSFDEGYVKNGFKLAG